MGELLCEVMRPKVDVPLDEVGVFYGPYPSGAPGIFIDTVARLCHKAGIVGGVGKDDFGKCLLERFKKSGVDCSQITEYDDGTTGVAFVTYFSDGSRRFLYHFPDTPATRPKAPKAEALGEDVQYYHIMGCSLMAKEEFGQEILKLMRNLSERGTKISFDPNIRPELMRSEGVYQIVKEVMKHTYVLFPGVAELLMVSEKENVEEAVKACFEYPNMEIISLKEGVRGCRVYTRDEGFSLSSFSVEEKDPTGAGDCFDAAFLCGLLEKKDLVEAATMASAAAALNVKVLGPMEGDISKETIEELIQENRLSLRKIKM
jgi:sugar/nucleoside kinase (ribokinase family)